MSGVALRTVSQGTRTFLRGLSGSVSPIPHALVNRMALQRIGHFLRSGMPASGISLSNRRCLVDLPKSNHDSNKNSPRENPAIVGIELVGNTAITMARDLAAPGGGRGVPYFWDIKTGRLKGTGGDGMSAPVNTFLERWGHVAAVGGAGCFVWRTDIGGVARKWALPHDAPVNTVQLGEKVVVTGTEAATVYAWDLDTGKLKVALRGHTGGITSLALEGEWLISASADKTCRIWNLHYDRPLNILKDFGEVSCMSLKGRVLVTGSKGGICAAWNVHEGGLSKLLLGHEGPITALQIVEEQKIAISGSEDKKCRVWSLLEGTCQKIVEGHTAKINCLQQSENLLATGSDDKTCKIWDMAQEKPTLLHNLEYASAVTCLQLRGKTLVVGTADGTLQCTELDSV